MTDHTEDDIRNATDEQLNQWIAQARDDERRQGWWRWPDWPGTQEECYNPAPKPYAIEWWAAGPLLDELQDVSVPSWRERLVCWTLVEYGLWHCCPKFVSGLGDPTGKGGTAPEAIARAWLLAYHRGLLEADHD